MSRCAQAELLALACVDRLIHEPARMTIMAALAGRKSADFVTLLRITGLTKGNLSAHAIKLEEAGYVSVVKSFRGRTPHTRYALTPGGRRAFHTYRVRLRRMLDGNERSG
jgi:DNA-binding transcriptional ArsR family regulator